ncbi:hypothetical protein ACFY71_27845 [Streptomyces cinerochromogenes]|uniref:hypothetical protein n=1 Tax=Streptomyces cinerochromogenes TaxID=66422 RepID=UPI0036B30507
MGAAGAGAASGPGGERPDSSGLLEEGVAPWTGAGEAGAEGETEPVAGAPAGGSALSGTAATASATPVPLLPLPAARGGTEGAGTRSGAGAAVGESTEASGLLGGSSAVWSPDDDAETAVPPAPAAPAQPDPTGVLTGVPTPSAAWSPRGTTTGREAAEGTVRREAAEGVSGGTTGVPAASAAQAPAEAATDQEAAETVAGSGAVVAVPLPDLPDDRVPVPVQSEAAEDTSTWDVAAAGFGMLMLAFAGQGSADGEHQESTTGYATAAPAVWDTEATSTVRAAERTVDPGTAPFAEPELTTWRPAARAATPAQSPAAQGIASDVEIRCGNGAGELPDEPEAEGAGPGADGAQEDDDADDKGMVDLLTQDASTWGTRPVVPDSIG